MIKYRIFQIVMAVAVVVLIISTAIMGMFAARDVSEKKYKPTADEVIVSDMKNGSTSELKDLDAWLEYSIISDGFDSGNRDGFYSGAIYISADNINKLEMLNRIKTQASNGMFFSVIIIVACFLVVRKRRLYECVVWGGAAAMVIGVATIVAMLLSINGAFAGVKEMIFENNYSLFFSDKDVLTAIIPYGTAFKMFWVYSGTIFAGLLVTICVRIVGLKKSKPHKF
ncbi:MAG: hypothetical protein J6A00_08945 [Bacteroides sp.]|nr:hypothetical protein [Bacteroides sp.]